MIFKLYIEKNDESIKYESNTRSWNRWSNYINALRFADDIAFCVETEKDQQHILISLNKILSDGYGMRSNKKKDENNGVQRNKSYPARHNNK